MSEEIYIDGVNVAGCIYYNAEKIANCGMFALGDFKCEGQICLYKQLKRLEQENERLKEEIKKHKANNLELLKYADEDKSDIYRLEQLYQDEHCEVLRLQKGLKYIEKYTHSPIADTVRMGIIRNTIKELLNGY